MLKSQRSLTVIVFLMLGVLCAGFALAAPSLDWSRRYNGPAGGEDRPAALVVDGSGGVVVAGTIARPSGRTGYATLKYDAEGALLWIKRSPAAWAATATALVPDASGNVIVTGEADGAMLTIKYDGDGNELWSRKIRSGEGYTDGARAVVVSNDGALFIAGDSTPPGGKSDFLVVKMDADGTVLWTNRYAGPAGGEDEVKAMAVNVYGNVAVTGRSRNAAGGFDLTTVKYDEVGDEFWVDRYTEKATGVSEGLAMTLDADSNVYVAGASEGDAGTDMVVVKLSSYGEREWVKRYDGASHGDDRATGIALGPIGEILLTGWSRGAGDSYDLTTLEFSAAGDFRWENRAGGVSTANDRAVVAVDPFGQVMVAGSVDLAGGAGTAFLTQKIDTLGGTLWTKRLSSGAGSDDRPAGLALDTSTDVLVTGASQRAGGSKDFLTARYGQKPLWDKSSVDRTRGTGAPRLAVDATGVPHMCYGEYDETNGFHLNHATFDGVAWKKTIVSPSEHVRQCEIAVDSKDHVHIAFVVDADDEDAFGDVVRYAYFDGTTWTVDTIQNDAFGVSLTVDSNDRPHVVFVDDSVSPRKAVYASHDGTQWNRETVTGLSGPAYPLAGPGLAVSRTGTVHLLATEEAYTPKVFWYTRESGAWSSGEIAAGLGRALVLDADGKPHVLYFDEDWHTCLYAKHTGTRWITAKPMEGLPAEVGGPDEAMLHLDSAGAPHVFLWVGDSWDKLIHLKRTGSGWPYEFIETKASYGAVAGNGKDLFVSYRVPMEEEYWWEIRCAWSKP